MRELSLAMSNLEYQLQHLYSVSFNEAMTLCCISTDKLTASDISKQTGLAPSNTSKVLRAMEQRSLITRSLGKTDKRQMYFALSEKGMETLILIKEKGITIPEFLRPLF